MAPEVLRNEPSDEKYVLFPRVYQSTSLRFGGWSSDEKWLFVQVWCFQFWGYIVGTLYITTTMGRNEPNASCWCCGIPASASWYSRWYGSCCCRYYKEMLAHVSIHDVSPSICSILNISSRTYIYLFHNCVVKVSCICKVHGSNKLEYSLTIS